MVFLFLTWPSYGVKINMMTTLFMMWFMPNNCLTINHEAFDVTEAKFLLSDMHLRSAMHLLKTNREIKILILQKIRNVKCVKEAYRKINILRRNPCINLHKASINLIENVRYIKNLLPFWIVISWGSCEHYQWLSRGYMVFTRWKVRLSRLILMIDKRASRE